MHRRRTLAVVAATLAAAGLLAPTGSAWAGTGDPRPSWSALPSAVPAAGTFYPTEVGRLVGTATGGYALTPGSPLTVAAAGRLGLPTSGVSAVVLNVVATAGTADVGLQFSSVGTPVPAFPLVTLSAGSTRSILLTVPLATVGAFQLATTGGAATASADLVGFYAADDTVIASNGVSGGYQPVDPARLYDSGGTALGAGARARLAVDLGATANAHATALLLQVTAREATAAGSLAVGSTKTSAHTGTVSFGVGSAAGNIAVVPADEDSDGRLGVEVTNTSSGSAGVTVDVLGFYDDGSLGPNLRFRPLPQSRVVDTHGGLGAATLQPGKRETATASTSVVGDSTFGLVGVVTATTSTAAALDVSADGSASSRVGSVPLGAGTVTSAAVQTEVGAGRGIALRASEGGGAALDLTLDVTGSFEAYPPVVNPATRSWVPPVSGWQISAAVR